MKFGLLLTKFRQNKDITKTDLAEKVGVSPPYIMAIESGKKKPPTQDKCERIAGALDLNSQERVEFLNTAVLERSREEAKNLISKGMKKSPIIELTDNFKNYDRIPQFEHCPASHKEWVSDEVLRYHALPREISKGRKLYILKAKGDSMNKAGIDNGDLVLVDADAVPVDGKIVVVCVDHEYTMKRFFRSGDQMTLVPESTNPIHRPESFHHSKHDIKIRGVVDKIYLKELR